MVKALAGGRRSVVVLAVLVNVAALCVTAASSGAEVTAVKGYACGYYVNVGLFGGPQAKLGCEPQQGQSFAPASANTLSPSVTLPSTGSATPITAEDPNGAAAVYGPAVIFGGVWPDDVLTGPPSGPIKVSTQGTTGATGSVTSSADIELLPTPTPVRCFGQPAGTTNCKAPGGWGPIPVWGDDLHVECKATETTVSGSTTFVNAFHAKATDAEGSPLPDQTVALPASPPPNYTLHGVITNVGDVFTTVYNEQIVNADGSLTVNAVHMYLFGPVAVGDMVKGQVTCGTTPTTVSAKDTRAPTCGVKVIAPVSPEDPTPKSPREELIGVFDAGGLQSITNVQVTNGTVDAGQQTGEAYLKFTPGQKGPLTVTAKRTDESQDMTWSFDATDVAGNKRHCDGTGSPAVDEQQGDTTSTTTTSTTVAGGTGSTTTSTTTQATGGSTTTSTTRPQASTNTAAQTTGTTTTTTRPAGTSTAAANTTATQVALALTG